MWCGKKISGLKKPPKQIGFAWIFFFFIIWFYKFQIKWNGFSLWFYFPKIEIDRIEQAIIYTPEYMCCVFINFFVT